MRVCAIMGVTPEDFVTDFERRNLFNTPDEGRKWNRREAETRAIQMASGFIDGDTVVLLGSRVAEAFGLSALPHFVWSTQLVEGGSIRVGRVPHPSGRNRMLNDEDVAVAMGDFLWEALP